MSGLKETLILGSMHARALACGSNWRANLEGRSVESQLVIALTRVQIEREEVECLTMELDGFQRHNEVLTELYAEKRPGPLELAALAEVERRHRLGLPQETELLRQASLRLRRMPVVEQQRYTFTGWREYGAEPDLTLPPAVSTATTEGREA